MLIKQLHILHLIEYQKVRKEISIKKNGIGSGDILVPLRMLTSCAKLLDDRNKAVKLDEGHLFDFCSLITALALHDRIITLPVRYIPGSILDSSLFSYLVKSKTLRVLEWDHINDFEPEERQEVVELFGKEATEKERKMFLDRERYDVYLKETVKETGTISDDSRRNFIEQLIRAGKDKDWNRENPIILYKTDERTFLFRTAYYWEISLSLVRPFIPDFSRIPIVSTYALTYA